MQPRMYIEKTSKHGALWRLQIRERSDLWMALSKEAARKICGSVSRVALVVVMLTVFVKGAGSSIPTLPPL